MVALSPSRKYLMQLKIVIQDMQMILMIVHRNLKRGPSFMLPQNKKTLIQITVKLHHLLLNIMEK